MSRFPEFVQISRQHADCCHEVNHLDIALGSQGEVEIQLEIAMLLGFLKPSDYHKVQPMVEDIGRMLNGLIDAIEPSAKR